MKSLKILLAHPRHNTVGAHSSYVPINIGYIAAYLKKEITDVNLEFKLEVDPEDIFKALEDWKPDVVGISNYVWNASLSYVACEYAKKLNQKTLVILGGPEFPAGTGSRKIENTQRDATYDKSLDYLIERPAVDYFAYSDGEVAFIELMQKFIENEFSVKSMRDKNEPVKGCASLTTDNKKLLVGEYISRIGMEGSVKAEGRDVIPSPYLNGMLDKFLDGKFTPVFETSRGCPFLCTFCDQGLDETKITAFSTLRCADEIRYVGERVSKIKDGIHTIGIFDSNWGIYQKDVELADHIAKIMEKYDWPQYIYCSTPKSKRENLLLINDKLQNRVGVGLPMQSMADNVLKKIKRKNLDVIKQLNHIRAIQKRGKTAVTELIVPLPGETEQSYFDGLKFLMDNGVMTATYTLMQLCGAELGRDEAIKKYEMKSKYRILPRQFGEYKGKKVFEIEQVCISTNTMNLESYLRCRNHSFIVKMLSQQIFNPVQKLAEKFGINWYDLTREVANVVQKKDYKGKFKDVFEGFCNESESELFTSVKEAADFYKKPENYKALVDGDIGENLLEKYVGKAIFAYDDILTIIFGIIKTKLSINETSDSYMIINSAEKWLKNLYMMNEIFEEEEGHQTYDQYELNIDFDFPNWVSQSHMPFEKFKNKCTYKVDYDVEKIKYCRDFTKNYLDTNYDKMRAIARFVRERMTGNANIFEKQFQKIS